MKYTTLPNMNKTIAAALAGLMVMAAVAPEVAAAPKSPKITSVELDIEADKIVVTGQYFGGKKFRGKVLLHLAEAGSIRLVVDKYEKLQPTDEVPILLHQLIVSGLPQNIDEFAGVHLLEIKRKYREQVDGISVVKYKVGTSHVSIGTVGPEGPAGQVGADGAQGPAGQDGANVQDGKLSETSNEANFDTHLIDFRKDATYLKMYHMYSMFENIIKHVQDVQTC